MCLDHYIIFDFPGQVELFTHHNAVKELLGVLEKHDFRVRTEKKKDWLLTMDSLV